MKWVRKVAPLTRLLQIKLYFCVLLFLEISKLYNGRNNNFLGCFIFGIFNFQVTYILICNILRYGHA